jgi:hypothetical protein
VPFAGKRLGMGRADQSHGDADHWAGAGRAMQRKEWMTGIPDTNVDVNMCANGVDATLLYAVLCASVVCVA